jgi:hypothetical protein
VKYQSPTCRSIALGGILFLALMIGLFRSAELIKLVGSPLLFLPEKLQLVDSLHASDVAHFNFDGPVELVLDFTNPGRYAIFTANTHLLLSTNGRIQEGKPPTIHIIEVNGGVEIPVSYFERGLRIFDTRFAPGRPIAGFQIDRPGRYLLTSPWIEARISLTPDYTSGKEGVLTAAYLLQASILFTPIGLLLYRQYRKDRTRARQLAGLKHIDGDAFWQSQFRNKK